MTDEEKKRLYYLYEFTDEDVLSDDDNPAYPHLENYVRTGILTEKEFVEAQSGEQHGQ